LNIAICLVRTKDRSHMQLYRKKILKIMQTCMMVKMITKHIDITRTNAHCIRTYIYNYNIKSYRLQRGKLTDIETRCNRDL